MTAAQLAALGEPPGSIAYLLAHRELLASLPVPVAPLNPINQVDEE
jgi:hypothetical protein